MLAARVSKMVALKRSERKDRNVAIVLFNFPPNAGNIGTAAFLSVFESLWHTLTAMKAQGYQVDVPSSVDELREALLYGNAAQHGADANVHALISADDHVKRGRLGRAAVAVAQGGHQQHAEREERSRHDREADREGDGPHLAVLAADDGEHAHQHDRADRRPDRERDRLGEERTHRCSLRCVLRTTHEWAADEISFPQIVIFSRILGICGTFAP